MSDEPWLAELRSPFPQLNAENCRLTSPADPAHNCVAWAVRECGRWWWPDPMEQSYWPRGVPRVETVEAFHQAFAQLGFTERSGATQEPGTEKIAIFVGARG